MNIFTVTGNIGKDAEVRQLNGGGSVCAFPLAFTSGYGDNQKTTWARCSIFGKRAEGKLSQYLTKGQKITVSGEISLATWQDNEGNNRTDLNLFVKDLELGGNPSSNTNQGRGSTPERAPVQPQPQQQQQQYQQPQNQHQANDPFAGTVNAEGYDDDIPF